ncbi:ROK family protein [Klebsiella oxytoca]|uniref:ROK family protein n=1 Tax=Klebsiella oxytoca TaxID=571 RepID=UPI00292EEBF0|nr:ROK family protein [Klebsiella oxytoca]
MFYLGLDIGGTKMAAVVINAEGKEFGRYRTQTVKESYAAFIDGLTQFISDIKQALDAPVAIGMALPQLKISIR